MFASIGNLLARSFLVFILAYLWLSFYIRNIMFVFLTAFVIMLVVNFGFSLFTNRKKPKPVKKIYNPHTKIMRQYRARLDHQRYNWRIALREMRDKAFQRRKVKPYIFYGVIVLLTSFIVRLNIYYVIFSTILFLFALISLYGDTIARRNGSGQNNLRGEGT